MIELQQNQLVFSFPGVHPEAELTITLLRTMRIPDDGRTYPLPPSLGAFPLRHVDDSGRCVPETWLRHGGVMLPMYQSEAMWIDFSSSDVEGRGRYPFAVKIATGKISAVSGESWQNGLSRSPQDYVVSPTQPWLDGYCVEKGTIRQFVAMPLGEGFTAEEQLTGEAEHGGIQIIAYPMKRSAFERHFPKRPRERMIQGMVTLDSCCYSTGAIEMGVAPGGKMRQEIYDDPYQLSDWCDDVSSRCFVHICNSEHWRTITGTSPPTKPVTAKDYTEAGLPWYEYYGDPAATVDGNDKLKGMTSVAEMKKAKDSALADNEPVNPKRIIVCNTPSEQVREGEF